MTTSFISPWQEYQLSDGAPINGAKLFFYEPSTTTKKTVYQDAALTIPHTNPVVADASGRFDAIYGEGAYKVVLAASDDTDPPTTPIRTQDNYSFGVNDRFSTTATLTTTSILTASASNVHYIASGTITVGLLAASTAGNGFVFSIVNNGTGLVTIDPNSGELINGATTLVLQPKEGGICICTGSEWSFIGETNIADNEVTTTKIANNAVTFAKLDDDILAGATTATITTTDIIAFGDVSDTNKTKRTTVQGILDFIYMVGELKDIAGTTIPSKWLQCNGAAVSRTTYSALFAVIGTTYGAGDGSTTFNVPDFQRRTAVGSGGTGTATLANTVGSIGGAETHTLTINEMPSHEHQEGGHHESFGGAGGQTSSVPVSGTRNGGSGTTDVVNYLTFPTGGGQAHNNMQPSLVVTKIIYAGV